MNETEALSGAAGLLLFLAVIGSFLLILWIFLPFAVFGIQRTVDEIKLILTKSSEKKKDNIDVDESAGNDDLAAAMRDLKFEIEKLNAILSEVHHIRVEEE